MTRSATYIPVSNATQEAMESCKQLYCHYRSLFDKRPYRLHPGGAMDKKYSTCWFKIMSFARENELDPETLIRSVFQTWQRVFAPMPNQFYNDQALLAYRVTLRTQHDQVRQAFRSQQFACSRELWELTDTQPEASLSSRQRSVLLSRTVAMSALFRYCLACTQKYVDIADKYYEAAVRQYVPCADCYDEIWGELIPAEFRATAKENYDYYVFGNRRPVCNQ